jgi:Tol biopolymer transport system component
VAVLESGAVGRVSVSSRERLARGESGAPSISADGRHVAFESGAANLVAGDRNRRQDVFVRDRRRGTTVRASVSSRGRGSAENSFEPAISDRGRHVAFTSRARNLAPGDDDRATDVYVRDLLRRHTRRVSRGSAGQSLTGWATAPSISADGDLVAFQLSRTDLVEQGDGPVGRVMVRERSGRATATPGRTTGEPGRRSGFPALSADGRYVAFTSADPDYAPGDLNGGPDVFVNGPLR